VFLILLVFRLIGYLIHLTKDFRQDAKTIALVAHDHKKPDLVKWSLVHKAELIKHKLVATGTTGGLLKIELNTDVHCFNSGL
jgi:methylglyoxal synthase